MITELAVERVEFTCGHCWSQWQADYDLQHYREEDGTEWEYFSLDGTPTPSPYTQDGARPCPDCHRHWVGHLAARRLVPLPAGGGEAPRSRIGDAVAHRPERHTAPPLPATRHREPTA